MKKVISLILAVLMAFSFVTVSFAEGEVADDNTTVTDPTTPETDGDETTDGEETTDFGDFQWIMDLPFWTVKSGLKFAKVAVKLVAVYLKVAKIFGLVEKDMDDMIIDAIMQLIQNTENGETLPEEEVPAESTTVAAA